MVVDGMELCNTEYEIKSSFEGIVDILISSFGLSLTRIQEDYKENGDGTRYVQAFKRLGVTGRLVAELQACILIRESIEKQDSNKTERDLFSEVCLDVEKRAAGPIPSVIPLGTDYVVVMSEIKKLAYLEAAAFVANYMVLPVVAPAHPIRVYVPMIFAILGYFKSKLIVLDENEKAIMARIFGMSKVNNKRFSVEEFQCFSERTPSHSGNAEVCNECGFLSISCSFRKRNSNTCILTKEDLENVLLSLKKKKILVSSEAKGIEYWGLVED